MQQQPQGEQFQLALTWVDVDKMPVQFANSMLAQLDDFGDILVTFGVATPPALTGKTPEENRKQLERIAYVPVRPVTRVSMSRLRLEQFVGFLQQVMQQHDQLQALLRQQRGGEPTT